MSSSTPVRPSIQPPTERRHMSTADHSEPVERVTVAPLRQITERNQVWDRMAAKWGVENPVPPWKTSLDGLCDALDAASCGADLPSFKERRDEEDTLSAT